MDLTVSNITYSSCGHINVTLGDDRKITLHRNELLELVPGAPPDMKELFLCEILKLFVKLRMRPILLDDTKTLGQKWVAIQDVVAKGVSLWQ